MQTQGGGQHFIMQPHGSLPVVETLFVFVHALVDRRMKKGVTPLDVLQKAPFRERIQDREEVRKLLEARLRELNSANSNIARRHEISCVKSMFNHHPRGEMSCIKCPEEGPFL